MIILFPVSYTIIPELTLIAVIAKKPCSAGVVAIHNKHIIREMATSSHTIIPELTLIAVIAKKPCSAGVVLCEYKHTESLDPAGKNSQLWSASRLQGHRLGFHREGPSNQNWSSGWFWSLPDP
jgi:hypothetical protein